VYVVVRAINLAQDRAPCQALMSSKPTDSEQMSAG